MDIHQEVIDILSAQPVICQWPLVGELLSRIGSARLDLWGFPLLACRALGVEERQALPGAAAIACAHAVIRMVDDLLDDDPRGEHNLLGKGPVANICSTLQAAGVEVLAGSNVSPDARLAAIAAFNRAMSVTALGQAWDAENPQDEAAYWRVAETKSAPLFSAAFALGGVLAGATPEVVAGLHQLGTHYGLLIQISDDMDDAMQTPANSDWLQGRWPLPLLYAKVVDHPARQRFLLLRSQVEDPAVLEEAQTILVRCGAISYCLDQVIQREQKARDLLNVLPLTRRDEFASLFEKFRRSAKLLLKMPQSA